MVFRSVLLAQLCHYCFCFSVIAISDRHDKLKTCENVLAALLQKWFFPSGVQSYQGDCEESQLVLTYLLLLWQGTVKDKRIILCCCRTKWHPSLALINLERKLVTHCYFIKSSSLSWETTKNSLPAAVSVLSISAMAVMSEDRAEIWKVHEAVQINQMQHLRNPFC